MLNRTLLDLFKSLVELKKLLPYKTTDGLDGVSPTPDFHYLLIV